MIKQKEYYVRDILFPQGTTKEQQEEFKRNTKIELGGEEYAEILADIFSNEKALIVFKHYFGVKAFEGLSLNEFVSKHDLMAKAQNLEQIAYFSILSDELGSTIQDTIMNMHKVVFEMKQRKANEQLLKEQGIEKKRETVLNKNKDL